MGVIGFEARRFLPELRLRFRSDALCLSDAYSGASGNDSVGTAISRRLSSTWECSSGRR